MIINGITYNETIKRINGDNSLLQMRILINDVYYGFGFSDDTIELEDRPYDNLYDLDRDLFL